ncbi:sugar ABC transporter substrate-binding protein [Streptosporangium carneum]|uniref:Sugar ABC transporter substrate-binding protein n=1 Tax=Streptosporangium carneum TaxID=47481 RepID=A0A9W6I0Z1_9ACTN|nr:sugar ABC transporter substrate-binding protein [Streptosporangium carneum]GLK09441.1 sugar ABC transporter substrate-binding protein [Streptosporangium carneum]
MKFTKIAVSTATTAVLALGLAACGSGTSTSTSDSASADPSAAASSAGPKYAGQTLSFWRWGDPTPEQKSVMEKVVADFEKNTGAKVNVQWSPWTGYAEKFQAAAAGSETPDVTEIGNTDVITWAAQDVFLDLTDKVGAFPGKGGISQGMWDTDTLDGKIYGVPWMAGDRAVIYRKDWFKELKLEVPKTWDELVAAAKTISEKKKGTAGFEFNGGSDMMQSLAPFVWGVGGEIAKSENGKWVSKLSEPTAREGIKFYTDLITAHKVSPVASLGRNSIEIARNFANGKTGMYIDGSWAKAEISKTNKKLSESENVGAFALPAKDGNIAPQFAGGSDLAIGKDSKHPEAAWELIQMLMTEENNQANADAMGLFPTYGSLLQGEKYKSDEWLGPFAAGLVNGKGLPASPNWVEVDKNKLVIHNMLRDIVQGKKTLEAATDEAGKQVEELLNQ